MKNEIPSSQVLLEIARGYSIFTVNKKKYYFRHFSIEDMLELDEFETTQLGVAKKKGIKSETELIKNAMKYGSWTQQEEDKISSLEWTISNSTRILNKINDPISRKSFSDQIEGQRGEVNTLLEKKNKISSYSAETLAQQKRLSKMILNSLFYDKEFETKVEDQDIESLGGLIFSKFAELANKDNLLKASFLTYFFDVFMSTKNSLSLFNSDFMGLTIFQKGLISYSRVLLNKIKNTKIPEEIYGDPVKMFDYEEKEEVEENTTHGIEDIKNKMKAGGGELKAEDLLS